jgi:hypothetical protein
MQPVRERVGRRWRTRGDASGCKVRHDSRIVKIGPKVASSVSSWLRIRATGGLRAMPRVSAGFTNFFPNVAV